MRDLKITDKNLLIDFLISPRKRVYRHLLLLILIAVMSVSRMMMVSPEIINNSGSFIAGCFGFLLINGCAGYFTIYLLTPHFLLQKKYLTFSAYLLAIMLLFVAGEFLIEAIFIHGYHFTPGELSYLSGRVSIYFSILSSSVACGVSIVGASFTVLLQHWMISGRRVLELENVSLHSELEQLKNQINPDFLFNMLDKAAKSTKSNPEEVSQLFVLLSKVLRYQLYDSVREKVLLHADILFLDNRLKLQTIPSKGLSYSLSEDGDTSRALVPPLLFSLFIEYIIKQIPENAEQTHIRLHFRIEDNKLTFTCVGSGLQQLHDKKDEDATIELAKRRLDLLFPNLYELRLTALESTCTIYLTTDV